MIAQKYVENYFTNKNIPFRSNIFIGPKRKIVMEFDMILPNTMIEIKSGKYADYANNNNFDKMENQIKRFCKYVPKYVDIWIYFHTKQPEYVYNFISNYKRVRATENIEDIVISMNNYDVCTNDSGVLRSLTSDLNKDRFYVNRVFGQLTVLREAYYHAIANMYSEGLDKLNQIDMCFTDKYPQKCLSITGRKIQQNKKIYPLKKIDSLWKNFDILVPYYTINVHTNLMDIPGITIACRECHNIYFKEKIID